MPRASEADYLAVRFFDILHPARAAAATAETAAGAAEAPSAWDTRIAVVRRCDMSDHFDRDENAEPRLANEPRLKIDPNEAIEPIENAEPVDPIDRNDPFDPIDRNESLDHSDRLSDMVRFSHEPRRIHRDCVLHSYD